MGGYLAAEREARSLSIEDVAHHLLLSRRHVHALERPDPKAFHAPIYFVRGLQKYCEYLGVTPDLFDDAVAEPPDEDEGDAEGPRRRRAWVGAVVVGLALAAAAVGGAWYVRDLAAPPHEVPGTVSPAVRLPGPEPLPGIEPDAGEEPGSALSSAVPEPARAPVTPPVAESRAGAAGSIAVGRASWVFVRYPDNSTEERSVAAGESVSFRAPPVYIAVGTTDGVTLMLGNRTVDVSPYIREGQVRISRAQIEALTGRP